MKILSIETSCDDTAITIFEAKGGTQNASFKILANNSNSQINTHIPYGGVFPALAKREHIKNLPILLEKTLEETKSVKIKKSASDKVRSEKPVDLITVTNGPGLEPSLWTGVTFAKELSKKWKVPIVPVNHMEGHILSPFGKHKGKFSIKKIKTPILSLLVSGGHTQLVLSKKWMQYEIIGETLDDAVGEAFDKVARMLGLPYPGGPEISKMAEKARISCEGSIAQADEPSIAIRQQANMRAESARNSGFFLKEKENQTFQGRNFSAEKFTQSSGRRLAESPQSLFSISLPRPMLHSKNLDFSFSGLKTAVLYLIRNIGELDEKTKSAIALEFENAAIECLVQKTKKAIEKYKIKTLIVAGGVAANRYLRSEMEKMTTAKAKQTRQKIKLLFPTQGLSGDNSIMIGIAGYLNYIKNKKKTPRTANIKASGNLRL